MSEIIWQQLTNHLVTQIMCLIAELIQYLSLEPHCHLLMTSNPHPQITCHGLSGSIIYLILSYSILWYILNTIYYDKDMWLVCWCLIHDVSIKFHAICAQEFQKKQLFNNDDMMTMIFFQWLAQRNEEEQALIGRGHVTMSTSMLFCPCVFVFVYCMLFR